MGFRIWIGAQSNLVGIGLSDRAPGWFIRGFWAFGLTHVFRESTGQEAK